MASKKHRVLESRGRTLTAKLLILFVKLTMKRKAAGRYKNPERKSDANRVPKKISHDLHVESFSLDRLDLHTLAPFKGPSSNKHIVFLHGGAYVMQATSFHWRFLKELVEEIGVRVSFVQYPLAPEHNHQEALAHTIKVTQKIRQQYPEDQMVLAGDSAGGGLAIATVQELIAQQLEQPYIKLLLISPWLDATSLDRVPDELKAKEAIMDVEALRYAAERYAEPDTIAHRHVSPMLGGFGGFPETAVWMGGCEYFYHDLEFFLQKLEAAKVDYHAYIAEQMIHDYPLLPAPEGAWAINQMAHFIHG